ncbi:photosynthetic reaction center cytochrome PufC [Pararhizobium mangrovi]|uniref:Photosynthetic reaction center cytochrome c subunit n=1 Tax=Pararhizobium mangrovi TaxID=2590452 RepID=A0A506U5G2_9HYPH|nr:photosynthetic reaction center cytochrome PufC [Pararhizobium mangrovi]TPW29593.1 photosynthetic reaction center cytochrome c subunit [Pararhizobium mangrovi]
MRYTPYAAVGAGVLVAVFLIIAPPWQMPWNIRSTSTGPAAGEMVQFDNVSRVLPYSSVPKSLPAAASGGPSAGEAYQNVKVLGDVSKAEFDRTMKAITAWVAPDKGCNFCHVSSSNYASDDVYTKIVARQMLAMTRTINADWQNHVGQTGVTCYTCHRGQNMPPYHWYEQADDDSTGLLGRIPSAENFHYNAQTIRDFFPTAPDEMWLLQDESTNAQSMTPMAGDGTHMSLHDTEHLYILMMQMADGIGVNCTYCHNSRAFADWSQSTPFRLIGWYGMQLARALNTKFVQPLATVIPKSQLGHLGDPAKIDCATCHIGKPRPLDGANMLADYPALQGNGNASPVVEADVTLPGEKTFKDTTPATLQIPRNGPGGPEALRPSQTPGVNMSTPPLLNGPGPNAGKDASQAPTGDMLPTGAEPQPGILQQGSPRARTSAGTPAYGRPERTQPAIGQPGTMPSPSVKIENEGGYPNLETGTRSGTMLPPQAGTRRIPPRNVAPRLKPQPAPAKAKNAASSGAATDGGASNPQQPGSNTPDGSSGGNEGSGQSNGGDNGNGNAPSSPPATPDNGTTNPQVQPQAQ